MKTLVTGANGFVGRAVCNTLNERGTDVQAVTRAAVGNIGGATDWSSFLMGADAVVHLAARVHQMKDAGSEGLNAFREVNVDGTRRLAVQAAQHGVRRFVFVSSIKVNGERTPIGQSYTEDSLPDPVDAYGVSKLEAEQALRELERAGGCQTTILRPPLMYGAGVKANFRSLSKAVRRGVPLPFGCITQNRRSLLNVRNLADAVALALRHPGAAGETFLVSDGEPISTAELVRRIAAAAGRSPRMLPVPLGVLTALGKFTGKRAAIDRITGSLMIDDNKIRQKLGWTSPHRMEEGLKECLAALA